MRGIQGVLGLALGRNKADSKASLLSQLGQPDVVRAIVAKAPPGVQAELLRVAEGGDTLLGDDCDDEYLDDDGPVMGLVLASYASAIYEPNRETRHLQARRWAAERGIMIGSTWSYTWSYTWSMPAEVALALRGPDYRAPFMAKVPATTTTEVGTDAVESESAVATTTFAGHTLAILDLVHRSPLTALKHGGVGVRELNRLAKNVSCGEAEARLSLELAHASGLLQTRADGVATSEQFDAWRRQDPGFRRCSHDRAARRPSAPT